MESRFYTCKYCFKEFEPKRRRVQKYCSDTCRNKAHHAKKVKNILPVLSEESLSVAKITQENTPKKETMSLAGVGNSTAGNLLANGITSLLTPEGKKAATKKDILELKSLIAGARYFPVNNLSFDQFGRRPYYDIETQELVYL
ncbi:hypothetical protein [Aestuariibaculum suncheonense]|uniref:Uncharacterized protein n=1 Tax=Aestuariibaculum suncheonense TaxID=1028745 RepID=A0A8J6Q6F8_9FLAO|nr:hypothetical protein [Aestuariibaculum suncheonense]MBD0835222.1 hypothetical protein [Aestuariibaculum suncheonense]